VRAIRAVDSTLSTADLGALLNAEHCCCVPGLNSRLFNLKYFELVDLLGYHFTKGPMHGK
jgi:hypothetical protein